MSDKNLDLKIKEALYRKTDIVLTDKDSIKTELDKKLFLNDDSSIINVKRKRKKHYLSLAVIAASLILCLLSQTDTGYAFVDKIKSMFVPEKEIVLSLEGQEEKKTVNLHADQSSDYVIYVDDEMYSYSKGTSSDIIEPKLPLDSKYPKISMEIQKFSTLKKDDLFKEITSTLASDGFLVTSNERINDPISSHEIVAIKSFNKTNSNSPLWDDEVRRYYIIESTNEDLFLIKQNLFTEALEGHGARFNSMLKEFRIIEEN